MEAPKNNNNVCFYDVFDVVLDSVPNRSKDIVAKRFGIGEEKPVTLQAIGDEYGVTRERVRQIVQSGIKCVCTADGCVEFDSAQDVILNYIDDNHKIVTLSEIEENLGGNSTKERGAIRFLIEGMSDVEFVNPKKYPVKDDVIIIKDFDVNHWIDVHNTAKEILEQEDKVHTSEELHQKITQKHDLEHHEQLERFLMVSSEIGNNPFDKWGLYEWDEITPRGVREKALLIMKEEKRPMHFREIAEAIDKYGLSKNGKKSHPQTVHNELIRDDNFVLVGRGMYTLKNDEHIEGTVKDVIKTILENSNETLTTEEIIEKVLEKRYVKPSTVKVNLSAVAKKMNRNIS